VLLLVLVTVAAISGDQVGYLIGYKTGRAHLPATDSRFFKREHLLRTQAFYEKHGGQDDHPRALRADRADVRARRRRRRDDGVQALRHLQRRRRASGGCGGSRSSATARNIIPREWLEPAVLVIVFLSILPLIIEWWRHRNARARRPPPSRARVDRAGGARFVDRR
jgi:membrane-associated protein